MTITVHELSRILDAQRAELKTAYDNLDQIEKEVIRVDQPNKRFIIDGDESDNIADNEKFEVIGGPNHANYTVDGTPTDSTVVFSITEVDADNYRFTVTNDASGTNILGGTVPVRSTFVVAGSTGNNKRFTVTRVEDFQNLSQEPQGPHLITVVHTGRKQFSIQGDHRNVIAVGTVITVTGGNNAGTYTVNRAATFSNGRTTITVDETISNGLPGGNMTWDHTTSSPDSDIWVAEPIEDDTADGKGTHTFTTITVDQTIRSADAGGLLNYLEAGFTDNSSRQLIQRAADTANLITALENVSGTQKGLV